jgi:hypothetical protein
VLFMTGVSKKCPIDWESPRFWVLAVAKGGWNWRSFDQRSQHAQPRTQRALPHEADGNATR